MTEKHAPASRAILMAMGIRWYGAKRIAQYGRSRVSDVGVHKQVMDITPTNTNVSGCTN